MALKTHIIARTWTPAGAAALHVETLCGAWGFKAARGLNGVNEWEAGRQLGGLIAVPESAFMPSRYHDCAKCRRKWEAGA